MHSMPVFRTASTPVVLPLPRAALWLAATALLALAVYYFVGIDQGAVSAHDARHFLGFPCH